jgi:hypothetical protein
MELGPLKVEIASNKRRDAAGGLGVNEKVTNNGACGKDRQISAISSAVKVVEPTRIATPIIPDHRHSAWVAGDVERRNTTRTNDDSKQRRAILIRS